MMTNRCSASMIVAALSVAALSTSALATDYYTGASRINNSNGLLTFSDITQNGQTLVNYMDQGLTVDVNDFAFVFTPCGMNNPNLYYPNGGVNERIEITRTDGNEINILEIQTSHGFAGCNIWAWVSVYDNNGLIDEHDFDVTGGTLIGMQGAFTRVLISSYNDQATRDQHNAALLNAIALDNMEYESGGAAFDLSVRTSCPNSGPATLTASNGTGGNVAFVYSFSTGNFQIPNNRPCAGTLLGLGGTPVLIGTASGNPAVYNANNVPGAACRRVYLQAIDLGNCDTSPVRLFQ